MKSNSGLRTNYNSIREVRFFCQKGGPTIEGSIPISEQPTLTIKQQGNMFAVRSKQGMYLTIDGDWCVCYEVDKIKWYKHYLEAEEHATKNDLRAIGILEVFKDAVALKDSKIRQLNDEILRKEELIDTLDTPYGIKPLHADEASDT